MPSPKDRAIRAERRLLAALCQGSLPHKARERIRQRLAQHLAQRGFQIPEDEIIFRAASELLSGSSQQSSGRMREALTAKVTRMGFPDTDIERLFSLEAASEEEIPRLFDELGLHEL